MFTDVNQPPLYPQERTSVLANIISFSFFSAIFSGLCIERKGFKTVVYIGDFSRSLETKWKIKTFAATALWKGLVLDNNLVTASKIAL